VLLLPDQAIGNRARQINDHLRQGYPQSFALNASHVPHISILHRYVSEESLPKVYAAVGQVAATHPLAGLTLTASGLEYSQWQGHQITSITVQKTPQLSALQNELVAALRPYEVKSGGADAFVTTASEPNIGEQTIEYVRTFAEKRTGDNFKPHITLGLSDARPADELQPMQFKVDALAVYQLGNVGTARKELWRYASR
jgi:2'-5' RNA ligase